MNCTAAQQKQNWQSFDTRPMCGNCAKARVDFTDRFIEKARYTCNVGKFKTQKTAVCDEYVRGLPQ